MKVVIIKLFLLFLVTYFVGCINNDKPKFEELNDGSYVPRTITNYSTYGSRDGSVTQVFVTFELENNKNIQLKLEVTYNPIAILSSGSWKTLRNESIGGKIKAISLKFLGGQGEGPSIGGRFELEYNSQPLFRAFVPLRPINKPSW